MRADQLKQTRQAAGLSQRDLARRAGLAQPHIARIESGRVTPTQATLGTLRAGLRPLPSESLRAYREEVIATVHRHRGTGDVGVFGSVARGEDRPGSDVDLLVDFLPDADLFDVLGLEDELAELLGCRVDVIPVSSTGRVAAHAARDAVPL